MVPNVEPVADVFGPCSTGVLRALNVSARKRILKRSVMGNILFTERSRRRCESKRTLLKRSGKVRRLLATWSPERRSKMAVLNQWSALRWSEGSASLVESPVMIIWPQSMGWPLCRWKAPLNCQPPATKSSARGM